MPEKHKRKHLTSFQMIILGFAGVILLGSLLLMLPVSSAERVVTPFDQALFTSTSAVCVTGLVVQDTGSYWSGFGHLREDRCEDLLRWRHQHDAGYRKNTGLPPVR